MRLPESDDLLLRELAGIYDDADALHETWNCPMSTECCRPSITGREPFVTSIEILAIERAVARRGGLLAIKASAPDGACRLLRRDGRCSIYADRPLGCRTFYCRQADRGDKVSRRALAELVNRLRDLAVRHRTDGDKPRPLGRVLGA